MEPKEVYPDERLLNKQKYHWENVFLNYSSKFGYEPSESAKRAVNFFNNRGLTKILELGAGQGRDSLYFAKKGLEVFSVDYSKQGLKCI
ncbi:hypothetical protein [Methanohalophilus portucalensis]|nr:hypothetical protein [Methanohalophilus portucalensis]OJH49431.1 methyltransferase type 11 [Methanohalophilus portucalensis FDF-1]